MQSTTLQPRGYGNATIQAAIQAQLAKQPQVQDPMKELCQYFTDGLVVPFEKLPNHGDIIRWWEVSTLSLCSYLSH
jgi:hypothetical protein